MIQAHEIRQRYIDFYVARGHHHSPSAPLVPPDDPTLLFTTAGMVQFKPFYSGEIEVPYRRAVSVQKCLRAGGKGSDLENVGRTLRHHTFFEMLGNFSFGDYFKKETIEWAWEFCTGEEWLNMPPERIWATIYGKRDPHGVWTYDDEAEKLWLDGTGIINPLIRLDEVENFWGPAGDTGACGPCSEIKFFMGTDEELKRYQELARSGEQGMEKVAHDLVEEGDLFLEIWNLVFPQFDQQADGSRPLLKNKGIDTGAGLERVTTACQMAETGGRIWSPYETDLLEPIVAAVSDISGLSYPRLRGAEDVEAKLREQGKDPAAVRLAMNACADHARTLTFALTEGVVPSNEGRGYVIRRILRRAARFGKKIGIGDPFLWQLIDPVIEVMGKTYPEIKDHPEQVKKLVRIEEERFSRTLHLGSEMLEQVLDDLKSGDTLPGDEAYRLYDTYGFPLDLTIEIAEERGIDIDEAGYAKALAEGKARARASWKGGAGEDLGEYVKDLAESGTKTEFVGFSEFESDGIALALIRDGERHAALEEGQHGMIVLDRTPFYGEGGGQIGDTGMITTRDGVDLFRVEDTQKTDDGFVFHFGEALNRISEGNEVHATIERDRREATMRNHSATHLLQGALKRLIGTHVTQSGSYVGPDYLRFDFTNPEAVPESTLSAIEAAVNEQVRRNLPVKTEVMDLESAKATGAIAPFGEKYGARVRVVKMEDFSTEFCGGTHVKATGDIGAFVVTGESSVASGIRRIEAKTGAGAEQVIAQDRGIVNRLSRALAVSPDQIEERISGLQRELKELRRSVERAKAEQLAGKSGDIEVQQAGDTKFCVAWVDGADLGGLRTTLDKLKSKNPEHFVAILGSGEGDKATLIAGATDDLKGTPFEAGKLIRDLAPLFEGRGGGKPQFAQAGGKDPGLLKSAIESGKIAEQLQSMAAV